ncbi:hypothetical protein [Streptomyces sp. G-G2]|uniref:hypothetical protein n=1 Tax=Streptomyces sp. G-G2 TaxID=3046201 RepID=UPI0024BAA108|nr:hypothetical protein [Streptomyces sp. G-G2]MDJ0381970.1 hypothetical protein [Streptomyces sp. G-G2]
MSTNRPRRIDQSTAEQLLGASPVAATGDHEALVGLLGAAAAPAAEGELVGEQAALAAFRAAQLAPAPAPQHPRKWPMRKPTLAKLLSAKVAAVAVATALGGVAVAAGAGHLPAALGGDPARGEPGPAVTSAAATVGAVPPAATRRPAAPVPTELVEPCRAYVRAVGARPKDVPADQRFAVLVAAAGSPENVPRYCAPALDAPDAPSLEPTAPAGRPSPGRPSSRPTPGAQEPGNRPTAPGPAQTHTPNGPGSHQTGPPDNRPGPTATRPKG